VFEREPLDLVVVDSAKLRQAMASALIKIARAAGTGYAGQPEHNNGEVLKDFREFVELVDEAIGRGPTAEEHRVLNYILELARRGLLDKLRRCGCACGCRRWLYQIKATHTNCEVCSGRRHGKDEEARNRRNAQAQERYLHKKAKTR
jgi:hypothetical protein